MVPTNRRKAQTLWFLIQQTLTLQLDQIISNPLTASKFLCYQSIKLLASTIVFLNVYLIQEVIKYLLDILTVESSYLCFVMSFNRVMINPSESTLVSLFSAIMFSDYSFTCPSGTLTSHNNGFNIELSSYEPFVSPSGHIDLHISFIVCVMSPGFSQTSVYHFIVRQSLIGESTS